MKTGFPLSTWTAVICVLMSEMWLSKTSVADSRVFGSGVNQFNMEFVSIGDPNNANDTTGTPNPAGSVGYAYNMGKFEVSEDMITKFNASQTLQITTANRGLNKPATSVSWNEAARFVNWLNTSTGGFAAYKFTTTGVNDNIALWTPTDTLDYNPGNLYRSRRADYVLPSTNEWYKAAYFDPNTGQYFNFPNGRDTAPQAVVSGTDDNTAVYTDVPVKPPVPPPAGPADIMLAGGLSPYGVMGMGGNAFEWEETAQFLSNSDPTSRRGARGGYWLSGSSDLSSSNRTDIAPGLEVSAVDYVGFRVVSLAVVPEPSSWVLALIGISGFLYRSRMGKKRLNGK